jgi:methylamine dehydrogenase accessory protein MauD
MGALMLDSGPKVGEAAPALDLVTLDGRTFQTGGARPKSLLLFFLSPTCPVCKKLLPILRRVAVDEERWLELAFASDGDPEEHAAFRARVGLQGHPYLLSTDLGMAYRIGKLPYAVLVDESGRVRAKGLVNSREQIESLFTARDLGVASVQEYLGMEARSA